MKKATKIKKFASMYATRLLVIAVCVLVAGSVVRAYVGTAQQVVENVEVQNVTLQSSESLSGEPMLGATSPNKGKPIAIIYNFLKGFYIGDTQVADSSGNFAIPGTLTVTGAAQTDSSFTAATGLNVSDGDTVVDDFIQGGETLSLTTTSASYTLSASDICDVSYIGLESLGEITTWTLPSTTTLFANCLQKNGKFKDLTIYNNSSATTTVIAEGTGGGLLWTSSSTIGVDTGALLRIHRYDESNYTAALINLN